MKILLLNLIIIPFLAIGQVSKSDTCSISQSRQDFNGFEKRLPIYHVDSCLFDILKTIVNKDSLCNYYRKDNTAYNFSIKKQEGWYLIGIRPLYLDRIKPTNYFGVFDFNKRKFLCWGDKLDVLLTESTNDSFGIKFCSDEVNDDHYLGGDVPSKKEVIVCRNIKLYFVITTSCD